MNCRQPNDVEEICDNDQVNEAIINSESNKNEGSGWWDSLYSAAKSKV